MYAVIKTGGKQYRVQSGEEILVEKLDVEPGKKVSFDEVLLVNLADKFISDPKQLKKAKVIATVLEQLRDEKIEVFKYRPKKRYRRKQGHRQYLTKVKVEEISLPGLKKPTKPMEAEKEVAKPAKAEPSEAKKEKPKSVKAERTATKKEEKKIKVTKQTKAEPEVKVKPKVKVESFKEKVEKKTAEKAANSKAKPTTKKPVEKKMKKTFSELAKSSTFKKSASKVEREPKKS